MRKYILIGLAVITFVAIPTVDGALVIWLAKTIGTPITITLIALSTIVGILWEGVCWTKLRRSARLEPAHRRPTATFSATAIVIASTMLLFLVPGFVTDAMGFVLLAPPVFNRVVQRLAVRIEHDSVFRKSRAPSKHRRRRKAAARS